VMEIAQAIARPSSDPVVTATVTVPNGDELQLVYEGGRWRVDAAAVDLYGQATPRQALMGFLRAFDRKRYDVILRYVPDAEIEGISSLTEDLATPPDAPTPPSNKPRDKDASPTHAGSQASPGPRPGAPAASAQLTADKLRTAWEGPQKDQINR